MTDTTNALHGEPMLTAKQMAAALGVHRQTIFNLAWLYEQGDHERGIPSVKLAPKCRRFTPETLERLRREGLPGAQR